MIDELIIVGFGLWFIEGKRARPVSDQDLWLELSSPGSPRDSAETLLEAPFTLEIARKN